MNLKQTALALLALTAFTGPAAAQMAGGRPMDNRESSLMQPANEPGTPPRTMRTDQRMEHTGDSMQQRGDSMQSRGDHAGQRMDRHHGWNRHHRRCRTVWYHHRRIQRCW